MYWSVLIVEKHFFYNLKIKAFEWMSEINSFALDINLSCRNIGQKLN